MTAQTMQLLAFMLRAPATGSYGLELLRESGLASGTVYPVLARLENAGWLASEWEAVDPAIAGRPRRRLYRMTAAGRQNAEEAIGRYAALLSAPGMPLALPPHAVAT